MAQQAAAAVAAAAEHTALESWVPVEEAHATAQRPCETHVIWEPEEECEKVLKFMEEDLPEGKGLERMRLCKQLEKRIRQKAQPMCEENANHFRGRHLQQKVLCLWALAARISRFDRKAQESRSRASFAGWKRGTHDESAKQQIALQDLRRTVAEQNQLLGGAIAAGVLAVGTISAVMHAKQSRANRDLQQQLRQLQLLQEEQFAGQTDALQRVEGELVASEARLTSAWTQDIHRLEERVHEQDAKQTQARRQDIQRLEKKVNEQDAKQTQARTKEVQRLERKAHDQNARRTEAFEQRLRRLLGLSRL